MKRASALLALLGVGLAVTLPAAAFEFGTLGVITGQTARLTVFNLATGQVPPNPCRVQLYFADANGRALPGGNADHPAQSTPTLAPGASATITLPVTTNFATRVMVRPVVHPLTATCSLATTADIADSQTGGTTVIYPPSPILPSASVFPPSPIFPPAPIFGLRLRIAGQTARLTVQSPVESAGNGSAQVELSFVDPNGRTLTNPDGEPLVKTVSLSKGQATFLDLENPLGAGVATLYRPVIKAKSTNLADEVATAQIIVTNELIDSATGKSLLAAPSDPCVGAFCLTVKGK
ncbi:hypothetical protein SAMN04487926_1697 [Paraburkholderia steynii]|uniref:Uncharacterized protein n=1 Tax=Paraburkholderia steynii TaxID=1245441 RepID=A0A7Z7FR52_9BURK|nr:hypothetical protein [Paraburkholderia steynii]SDJ58912.1 hypothetical protein SAMN04487926_1697 [Paraburkholderia steynii]